MSIVIKCDTCNKEYKVDDSFAWKKAKCTKCNWIIHISNIDISNINKEYIWLNQTKKNENKAIKTNKWNSIVKKKTYKTILFATWTLFIILLLGYIFLNLGLSNSWKIISSNYDNIYDIEFSPDWNKFTAVVVEGGSKYFILKNWKKYWEDYNMIYSWKYSKDSSKYFFMWRQWNDTRYLVENQEKTELYNWKTIDDYIDSNLYYWISRVDYNICIKEMCRFFTDWYTYTMRKWINENDSKEGLFINWIDKWNFSKVDFASIVLKWENYAFVWKKEEEWEYNIFINWEEKYSFIWRKDYSNTYSSFTISDDWESYMIVINWKIIKDWLELSNIQDYKNFENLEFTPWSQEINFLAYTTDGDYKKVMYKWWKIIWKNYKKISSFKYSPDWKKLIIIIEEWWKKFLVEIN